MNEVFEYVRIGQNNDGYALVEVCFKTSLKAISEFRDTIEILQKNGFLPATPQNRIETTNANKDRVPMVTVKGDEVLMPTEKFIDERKKVEK